MSDNILLSLIDLTGKINLTELLSNVAIIVGIYVSLSGLETWKRKIKGEQSYCLAKKLLMDVNKYKHAVCRVRNPVIWSYEYPELNEKEIAKMSNIELHSKNKSYVYKQRWEQVENRRIELYESILEARALWPNLNLEELFHDLFKHVHKLWIEIILYVGNEPNDGKDYDDTIIFESHDQEDIYNKQLDELVLKIEKILIKKLKKM